MIQPVVGYFPCLNIYASYRRRLFPVVSHKHTHIHKYRATWRAITVLFCFPGAQRRLTSRWADRKGAQSRWIGPVTGTTLIAGTRVSNCHYKTTADDNWNLQEFLQVWSSRIQEHKDRFTVLSVNHDISCVCQYHVGHYQSIRYDWHTRRSGSLSLHFGWKFTGNHVIYCLPVWRNYIALISVSVLPMTFTASFKLQTKLFCMH